MSNTVQQLAGVIVRDKCAADACKRCKNGAQCVRSFGNFMCICPVGFIGRYCGKPIKSCSPNPCKNQGQCVENRGNIFCNCPSGFSASDCSLKVVVLPENPFPIVQTTGVNKTQIKLYADYPSWLPAPLRPAGGPKPKVELCLKSNCQNGASCRVVRRGKGEFAVREAKCLCVPGFTGKKCEINIDDCASRPCKQNATCIDGIDSFTCRCPAGFGGDDCGRMTDSCRLLMPCKNMGQCVNKGFSFTCKCPAGWEGQDCSIDKDDCASNPCKNDAICIDKLNNYKCRCQPGFKGRNCEIDIDDCLSYPCKNGGTCADRKNDYECTCRKGFKGKGCEININDCKDAPCMNGGSCVDGVNSFTCKCPVGFLGSTCSINIDDCASRPCQNGAICIDGANSFKCKCPPGYSGQICNNDIDDCLSRPCKNNATCIDKPNNFECRCPRGFSGPQCENNIDDCAKSPCLNKGKCIDGVNSYSCQCPPGFAGLNCQINIDDCNPNPCKNGGACVDKINKFKCKCPPGFVGATCQQPISCQALKGPNNGFVVASNQFLFPSRASYKCNIGYVISSKTNRTCAPDGSWSGAAPSCVGVTCSNLPSKIPNGVLVPTADGKDRLFPSPAIYQCNPGFETKDPLRRNCQADGGWSGKEPVCTGIKCRPVGKTKNGRVSVSNKRFFPSRARYTCDAGFVTKDSTELNCNPDGSWSGKPPACEAVQCDTLPSIKNGGVSTDNSNRYPSRARYTCNEGFQAAGPVDRVCNPDGKWGGKAPRCKGTPCAPLDKPKNGQVQTDNRNRFPSTATYTCDAGFITKDSTISKCKPDGQWTGKKPQCLGVQCAPIGDVKFGSSTVTNDGRYPAQASFSCKAGYELSANTVRTCNAQGVWSLDNPSCVGRPARLPLLPKNGNVVLSRDRFPSTATYSCEPGFSSRDPLKRKMNADGSWAGRAPTCEGVRCKRIKAIAFGNVDYSNERTFPSTAKVTCESGFQLSSPDPLTCMPDGTWDKVPPKCLGKPCDPLGTPVRSTVKTTNDARFPSTATYTCAPGYATTQSRKRECKADGTWTKNEPNCKGIKCETVDNIAGGLFTVSNVGVFPSEVSYQCLPGYVLKGAGSRKCKTDGSWSGKLPICEAVACVAPPAPAHGNVEITSQRYPSKAKYSCASGYQLNPPSGKFRRCGVEGGWTGSAPQCGGVPTPNPPEIANTIVKQSSPVYPSETEYVCKPGFMLQGASKIKANTDGTWPSANLPACVPQTCKKPRRPLNGQVETSSAFYPSTATYKCSPGYALDGPEKRACKVDGSWSDAPPQCKVVACLPPRDIANGAVKTTSANFPSKAVYSCFPAFVISDPQPRACNAQGKWEGLEPVCKAACKAPKAPVEGNVTITSPVYPSRANFVCPRCRMVGAPMQDCTVDGRWDGQPPTCQCLSYKMQATSKPNLLGNKAEATLFVNGKKIAASTDLMSGDAAASIGDVIAVMVASGDTNHFIGAFKFKGRTINTNNAWKCSPDFAAGWEMQAFDDSLWARGRMQAPEAGQDLTKYGKASIIKASGHSSLYCRFLIGGSHSVSVYAPYHGYVPMTNTFYRTDVPGSLWATFKVTCTNDFLVGVSTALGNSDGNYYLVSVGVGTSSISKVSIDIPSPYDLPKFTKNEVTKGTGNVCAPGRAADVWIQIKDNKLSVGRGSMVGSQVSVYADSTDFGKMKFFDFSTQESSVTYSSILFGSGTPK